MTAQTDSIYNEKINSNTGCFVCCCKLLKISNDVWTIIRLAVTILACQWCFYLHVFVKKCRKLKDVHEGGSDVSAATAARNDYSCDGTDSLRSGAGWYL